jgi:hypothetical protein
LRSQVAADVAATCERKVSTSSLRSEPELAARLMGRLGIELGLDGFLEGVR